MIPLAPLNTVLFHRQD